jgi:hypothetical protein
MDSYIGFHDCHSISVEWFWYISTLNIIFNASIFVFYLLEDGHVFGEIMLEVTVYID